MAAAAKREDESKALVVTDTKDVANVPAHLLAAMEDSAGLGNSKDSEDAVYPFLVVLQKGSPQVNEEEPDYIPGAKAGMLFNTASKKVWNGQTGVEVICCGSQKNFVEWKPNRAGWAGSHEHDWELIKRMGAKNAVLPNGAKAIQLQNQNLLVDTTYVFVIVDGGPAIIGASSTALGPIRQWLYYRNALKLPSGKNAPAYSHVYRASTFYNKNDKGDWYNWKFTDEGYVLDGALYAEAEEFAKAIAANKIVIGRPDYLEGGAEDEDESITV